MGWRDAPLPPLPLILKRAVRGSLRFLLEGDAGRLLGIGLRGDRRDGEGDNLAAVSMVSEKRISLNGLISIAD